MRYAIEETNRDNSVSLYLIVSANSAKEALWKAGVRSDNFRHYDAVPVGQYAAHVGGRYDTSYYNNAS